LNLTKDAAKMDETQEPKQVAASKSLSISKKSTSEKEKKVSNQVQATKAAGL